MKGKRFSNRSPGSMELRGVQGPYLFLIEKMIQQACLRGITGIIYCIIYITERTDLLIYCVVVLLLTCICHARRGN